MAKRKLGELLVEQGAKPEDVAAALKAQKRGERGRIGDILLNENKVGPRELARAVAAQNGIPFIELSQVSPAVAALVPLDFQVEHRLVPFQADGSTGTVHLAVADPTKSDVLSELEFQMGRQLKMYVAAIDDINAVHQALKGEVSAVVIEDDDEAPAPAAAAAPAGAPDALPEEWSVMTTSRSDLPVVEGAVPVPAEPMPPLASLAIPPEPPRLRPTTAAVPRLARRATTGEIAVQPEAPLSKVTAAPAEAAKPASATRGRVSSKVAAAKPRPSPQAQAPKSAEVKPALPTPAEPKETTPREPKAAAKPGEVSSSALDDLALPAWLREGGTAEPQTLDEYASAQTARTVAALMRVLIKKGLVDERALLDELSKK